jgi:nifR3 family TIM-barrel protein
MINFWEKLPRPFFALAPLEDVTDAAFRRIIAEYGRPASTRDGEPTRGGPDVMFTEFTSADGLVLADESGQKKLRKKLLYSEIERPIVAQLFTGNPEHMEKAAKLAADLGFDGIDVNMGCPVDEVVRQACGAALIKNPPLAREIIRAAKRGACSCASQTCTSKKCLPVSVKTRLGYNVDELETWLPELLAENPVAITLHARTRKEMSAVPARWERIARAVEIRDSLKSEALIIGNGDVVAITDAREKAATTKCDGVMLGRAIFGNPWLFLERADIPTPDEKIRALIRHLELFDELLTGNTNFAVMKKHFKAYISGWDGAKDLRVSLMETETVKDALSILTEQ